MEKDSRGFVVVIDDETEMQSLLSDHLTMEGFTVQCFNDGGAALKFLNSEDPSAAQVDLVISDLRMPDVDGLSLLRNFKPKHPDVPVILMTAFASVESAVEDLRKGAFDYITKPFKLAEMTHAVERAILYGRLQRQNKSLTKEVKKTWALSEIIGKSLPMKGVFELIERIASSSSNILVTGESGTGKEVVAKAIHRQST